ncbi:unnamed protein product [Amoebophrya sp. A120]|nr:unnamed protein product [Amoebophrya sp. A120]|eukprot:GSA120T00003419001.1
MSEYAWVRNVCLEIASTLCGTLGKQLMRIGKLVEMRADAEREQANKLVDKESGLGNIKPPIGGKNISCEKQVCKKTTGSFASSCSPSSIKSSSKKITKSTSDLLEKDSAFLFGRSICILGVFINAFIGPFLDAFAYQDVAQSLITPLTGLGVVWNTLLAPCTLGEVLSAKRVIAITLIVLGIILTVCFAVKVESRTWQTTDDIKEIWYSWRTRCYVVAFSVLIAGSVHLQQRFENKHDYRRGFLIGCTAGALSGNMFCMKLLMELLAIGYKADQFLGIFRFFVTDFVLISSIIGGALFFSISNAILLAIGMRNFEVLYMVPIFEASAIILDGLSAAVVMRDFDHPVDLWLPLPNPDYVSGSDVNAVIHDGGATMNDPNVSGQSSTSRFGVTVNAHWRGVGYICSMCIIVLGLRLLVLAQGKVEAEHNSSCSSASSGSEEYEEDEEHGMAASRVSSPFAKMDDLQISNYGSAGNKMSRGFGGSGKKPLGRKNFGSRESPNYKCTTQLPPENSGLP